MALAVGDIISAIDEFYYNSFKISPESSFAGMGQIAEKLMAILAQLRAGDLQKMNEVFLLTVQAMENKDIVLLRDYLYYEVKPFLQALDTKVETVVH